VCVRERDRRREEKGRGGRGVCGVEQGGLCACCRRKEERRRKKEKKRKKKERDVIGE
jgi:hypothetical protein